MLVSRSTTGRVTDARVAKLPSATLSEHDLVALGAPLRLVVLRAAAHGRRPWLS
jgi:hypothetical protein